jgi:hypothetical protein
VQIRLTPTNERLLKELRTVYKKTCPDYDLSNTKQFNLLLTGRLKVALTEARKELAKNPCNT